MIYHIYSKTQAAFGPDTSGGSEEYHIRLANQLAAKGHVVCSYANCDPCYRDGVKWFNIATADPASPGIWIIQRDPSIIFQFPEFHPDHLLLFEAHDFDYTCTRNGVPWANRYDAVLAESEVHAGFLRSTYPKAKVLVTGAGFPMERVDEALAGTTRNPKRIIHTSNPTRGLPSLLKIFKRAWEIDPELELVLTFGFDSIDQMTGQMAGRLSKFKAEIMRLTQQPGVTWLGRLPTTFDVWREMAKSGIYCYPTAYEECFCNSVAEAQTFGAIPVVSAGWALGENTHHGVVICGNPDEDRLVRARFVRELVALANRPDLQEDIRPAMMTESRSKFEFRDTVNRVESVCSSMWEGRNEMVSVA